MTFRATGSQLSGPVLLFWKTQDGPAASDGPANSNPLLGVQDYVAASGWIVLSPSQPTATIPITLLGNNNSDSSKCMSVNLYRCAAGGATVPAGASPVATGAGTIVNSSAMLHVAAINDNVPTGYLPMSKQTTTGAFIPVDNGDADYDGIPDDEDRASQPVPGDDRLLPIYIQPVRNASRGRLLHAHRPVVPQRLAELQPIGTGAQRAGAQHRSVASHAKHDYTILGGHLGPLHPRTVRLGVYHGRLARQQ